MTNKEDILQRAQAASDKAESHRWDYEERRHFNILHPPKPETPSCEVSDEVVRRVQEDALIEQPAVDDINAALLSIVQVCGEEVGEMKRELEERISRIEKHLGISDIVYRVHTNE
jgi:hypothetical protein